MKNQTNTTETETIRYGFIDGLRGTEIAMTMEQAQSGSHQGDCQEDCEHLAKLPEIAAQLDAIGHDTLVLGLKETGAWDDEELADEHMTRVRAVWLAAGDITENQDRE